MQNLYSGRDLLEISAQLKKRYLVLGVVLAVLLAAFIVSLVCRVEWLSVVTFFLFGAAAVFAVDFCCLPLHRYKKLLKAALTGRTHTETLEYVGEEAETSRVDGVLCRGLLFLGEPDKHGVREQRFYWDAERPLPAFRSGEQVTLLYTGRNIIGWEA